MPPHHVKVPGPRGWRGWRGGGGAKCAGWYFWAYTFVVWVFSKRLLLSRRDSMSQATGDRHFW